MIDNDYHPHVRYYHNGDYDVSYHRPTRQDEMYSGVAVEDVPAVWGKVTIEVSTKMLEQDDYMRHLIDQMKHIFLYVPEMEISNSQISERTRTVRVEGWKLPEDHTERINRNIKNHMKKMELSYNIKEETE